MSRTIYDEVNICIKPLAEEIKVETRKKGITSVKNIALDDLLDSFKKSQIESKSVSTGFLPENCLSVNITDNLRSVVLWRPARPCDYTYFNSVYEGFPMPNMVFCLGLTPAGRVKKYRMAMAGAGNPKPDTLLYEYPFSNVYSGTNICIGAANSLPVYKNLHALASLPHYILSIPNNDHLFTREHNRLNLGYRELLDHLQDKDPGYYYESILVPRRDKRTLQDFIDKNIH